MQSAGPARSRRPRRVFVGVSLTLASCVLSACGGHTAGAAVKGAKGVLGPTTKEETVPVFDLRPRQCLVPPKANPNLDVARVTVVPCDEAHTEEVYCVLAYSTTVPQNAPHCPAKPPRFAGSLVEDYPGTQALETYANAVCLDEFQPYVGTSYKESSLYYTYLYPSPRSWDSPSRRDREVTCVLVSTAALERSAKGSGL